VGAERSYNNTGSPRVTTVSTYVTSWLRRSRLTSLPGNDAVYDGSVIPTPEPKRFTWQGLAGGFALIEEGLSRFEAEDPNIERYNRVARGVMDSLRWYKEILEEKKMISFQSNLQQYFKKVDRPAAEPPTDPVLVPSTSPAPLDSPAPVSPASSVASSQ
ncbi:tigger transposable element-derived protein 1, partial [Biomphalaria pfeifferi]